MRRQETEMRRVGFTPVRSNGDTRLKPQLWHVTLSLKGTVPWGMSLNRTFGSPQYDH